MFFLQSKKEVFGDIWRNIYSDVLKKKLKVNHNRVGDECAILTRLQHIGNIHFSVYLSALRQSIYTI